MIDARIAVATHAARSVIGSVPDGRFRPWTGLDDFVGYAASAGFDGIDASTSVLPVEAGHSWWRALQTYLAANGLELASINCLRSSLADEDHWGLGRERILAASRIARELGIPTVNISLAVPPERLDANAHRQRARPPGSSLVTTAAERERTLRLLGEIAREVPDGPERVLELHHCSLVDTAASMVDIVSRLDGRYLANADLVNELWAFDQIRDDWRDSLRALAPIHSGIWHVKNFNLIDAEFVDAPLDMGYIDYSEAVQIMASYEFEGWISIERSGDGDFLTSAARGLDFLKSTIHSVRST